jgi:integrase
MTSTRLVPTDRNAQHILAAIEARPLAVTTKAQYKREVTKALAAGVELTNATAVADYAAGLNKSSAAFLRAALKVWTHRIRLEVKSAATPDNMAHVGATLHRLDALDAAIELEPSQGQKAHVWLSANEVRRLMNAARSAGRTAKRDAVVLGLLLGAGLRRDELVNLTWRQVMKQGERSVLDIVGKGAKKRVIPVSQRLADILDSWRLYCEATKDERLVRGLARGGSMTDSLTAAQCFNIVRKYGRAIGKPELAPHDLRRTYAQLGYENGVPVAQLSRLLGHSSIAITQKYLNLELDLDVTASDFVPL